MSNSIKVEPPISREFLDVKAIRTYPPVQDVIYFVNSTIKRNEQPKFLVFVYGPNSGQYEIEIVFLGAYHPEREIAEYPAKPPRKWSSCGEFVLSPKQAGQFVEILADMQNAIEEQNRNGNGQPKIVQSMFGHACTIFDLSWFTRQLQTYATIFDYPNEIARLLSLFGHRKMIAPLRRVKRNGWRD